jgi:hypothetical protein
MQEINICEIEPSAYLNDEMKENDSPVTFSKNLRHTELREDMRKRLMGPTHISLMQYTRYHQQGRYV